MAVEISDDVELAAVGLVAPEIGIRLIARKKGEAAAGAYLRDLMVKVGNVNGIASGDGIFANAADKLAAGFHVGEAVNGGVDLVHHGLLNNDVDMHKNRLLSHEMTYYRYPAVVDVAGELNAVLYYRKRAESCVDTLGLDRSVADGVLSYPHYSGGTLPVGDAGIGHVDHGQCLKESRYEVGDAGTGTIMPTRMATIVYMRVCKSFCEASLAQPHLVLRHRFKLRLAAANSKGLGREDDVHLAGAAGAVKRVAAQLPDEVIVVAAVACGHFRATEALPSK